MKPATIAALMKRDIGNAIIAETPGGIERQEAEGQKTFVASTTLPLEFNSGTQEDLEFAGVVFGNPVDDLFQEVQLPEGWKKEATDHSMWSKLLDERGRERASIFYKAAFYDRSAFIDITRAFQAIVEPIRGYAAPDYRTAEWIGLVKYAGHEVWRTSPLEKEPDYDKGGREVWLEWDRKKDALRVEAVNWLNEHYPEWENRTAYWDLEEFPRTQ